MENLCGKRLFAKKNVRARKAKREETPFREKPRTHCGEGKINLVLVIAKNIETIVKNELKLP